MLFIPVFGLSFYFSIDQYKYYLKVLNVDLNLCAVSHIVMLLISVAFACQNCPGVYRSQPHAYFLISCKIFHLLWRNSFAVSFIACLFLISVTSGCQNCPEAVARLCGIHRNQHHAARTGHQQCRQEQR